MRVDYNSFQNISERYQYAPRYQKLQAVNNKNIFFPFPPLSTDMLNNKIKHMVLMMVMEYDFEQK